jgi:hypothetical protein
VTQIKDHIVVGYSNREIGHQGFSGAPKLFRKQYLLACWPRLSNSHAKAELQEQRGFASRLQKQEAKFNPYMVVRISIGYFTFSAM